MQVDVDILKIEREIYYTRLYKNIRFHGSRSRRRGTRRKGRRQVEKYVVQCTAVHLASVQWYVYHDKPTKCFERIILYILKSLSFFTLLFLLFYYLFLYFFNIISREQRLQLIGCCRDYSSDLYVHVCLSLYVREKAIERNNAEGKEAEKQGSKEERKRKGKGKKGRNSFITFDP